MELPREHRERYDLVEWLVENGYDLDRVRVAGYPLICWLYPRQKELAVRYGADVDIVYLHHTPLERIFSPVDRIQQYYEGEYNATTYYLLGAFVSPSLISKFPDCHRYTLARAVLGSLRLENIARMVVEMMV